MKQQIATAYLAVILTLMIGTIQFAWSQDTPHVNLTILNEPDPSGVVVVVKGEPVEVEFSTTDPTLRDMIQLVRTDDGQLVSAMPTGGETSGVVLLSTEPANSLGELEAEYVVESIVIATSDRTVTVVASVPPEPPTTVHYPNPNLPTLQAAVNLVADGGTVEVGSGVFEEHIVIADKVVNIQGNGAVGLESTEIIGADSNLPVFTIGPNGGGSFMKMTIKGGKVGIRGVAENEIKPAAVQVKKVRILDTEQGIFGRFSELTVKKCIISDTLGSGLLLLSPEKVKLYSTLVTNAGAFGLIIWNTGEPGPGDFKIKQITVLNNEAAGIVIVGNAHDVYIKDCTVGQNKGAGIALFYGGFVSVAGTHIFGIEEGSIHPYYNLGDGLITLLSDYVFVWDSLIENNFRAGLIYESSGGAIFYTQSIGSRFGAVIQGEPKPSYSQPSFGNLIEGTEENILTDDALPVPEAPPLPDEP